MNVARMVGNTDDFRETPAPMGKLEAVLLLASVVGAMVVIGTVMLVTAPLRFVYGGQGNGGNGAGDPDLTVIDQNMRISRGERK
jgi:hypothetical protein